MRIKLHILTASTLAAMVAIATPGSAQRQPHACRPRDDFSDSLMARSRYTLSFPKMSYLFEGSGLEVTDQNRIVPVQTDSLCQIAARTINRDLQQPDTLSRSVYLLKVGKLFWAVDGNVAVGRFYTVFIVDNTLTRILHRMAG